jgi:hypothetical protein
MTWLGNKIPAPNAWDCNDSPALYFLKLYMFFCLDAKEPKNHGLRQNLRSIPPKPRKKINSPRTQRGPQTVFFSIRGFVSIDQNTQISTEAEKALVNRNRY